ncbi:pirin family protein [Rhodococcus sp. HNM0569]|uniref:pirin family protein n=1 Tax=Rhodococcus sp. HNM0569 TaxID=2716340 RepID=UPI00146CB524|nr:pirin family protein [Rhodococcus sp. HNM0569]NLU84321.1 pirin family protein [Rhodococcus sp. HNM0569]
MTTATARFVPATDRTTLVLESMTSSHSFPFAGNFRLEDYAHGLLLVNNEDVVEAGSGFDRHRHAEMEIVTWIVSGSLVHRDSLGNSLVLTPDAAQRMSAGTGITHSEYNDSWTVAGDRHRDRLHVVQMWIPPDTPGLTPEYQELPTDAVAPDAGLVPVATGMPRRLDATPGRIHNRYATFHAARPAIGVHVAVPDAPFVHVFVTRGRLSIGTSEVDGTTELGPGDALRLTGRGVGLVALEPSEVLVWEMHAHA